MRVLKSILVPAALAALLAACGGSERVEDYVPTKLVAFGDELSVINSDGSKHGVNALKTNSTELDCATYPVWPQAVASGYGLVFPQCNSSGVLTTSAERPEEIDWKRAEAAKERAEERLRQKLSIQEYYNSKAALARAMARLKAARK